MSDYSRRANESLIRGIKKYGSRYIDYLEAYCVGSVSDTSEDWVEPMKIVCSRLSECCEDLQHDYKLEFITLHDFFSDLEDVGAENFMEELILEMDRKQIVDKLINEDSCDVPTEEINNRSGETEAYEEDFEDDDDYIDEDVVREDVHQDEFEDSVKSQLSGKSSSAGCKSLDENYEQTYSTSGDDTPTTSHRASPRQVSSVDVRSSSGRPLDVRKSAVSTPPSTSRPTSADIPLYPRPSPDTQVMMRGGQASNQQSVTQQTASRVNSSQSKRRSHASWITEKRWVLGNCIGKGSFGEVYQCMSDKGKLCAVKKFVIAGRQNEVEALCGEIELMRVLSHPNIVKYLGSLVDIDEGVLYIFQEWVPGGSVADLLKKFRKFTEAVVRNYTRQILLGLRYLHENNIVHRDIKGANLLVDDNGCVKLADFGASAQFDFEGTQETTTIRGTPYFMAPEVLTTCKYGRKGDIWAVGCTVVQMLTGDVPWKQFNLKSLIQLHMLLQGWTKGPPPMDNLDQPLSQECTELLNLCFTKNESKRPSADQLLQMPFIRDVDLEESMSAVQLGDDEDEMGDSGVMSGIREQLGRIASRSSVSLESKNEDTMEAIDRKIQEKEQQRQGIGKADEKQELPPPPPRSSNPFARQSNSAPREIDINHDAGGVRQNSRGNTGAPLPPAPTKGNPFASNAKASNARVDTDIRGNSTINNNVQQRSNNDNRMELNNSQSATRVIYRGSSPPNAANKSRVSAGRGPTYRTSNRYQNDDPELVVLSNENEVNDNWQCNRCKAINKISVGHCDKCALKRGSTELQR